MDVRIISKHVEITDDSRARIEEKVAKLPRYNNSIYDIEIIIEGGKGSAMVKVEIIVRARRNHIFVAKNSGEDMFVCIDEVVRKIERQLKKQKQKQRDNKHPGGAIAKEKEV
ncbi:MAG: ribosome-associated translation inhibitor RaiA [Sedimentisphaerales bacterium]